jgi:flavin reductase (DIM6/NTAB) family NADH-FMN oxidoreductase RutF
MRVLKDTAVQVGDSFVLNVLGEGESAALMKHFLKRFKPGADRFEGVQTDTARNGCPVLKDAIAHLECTVRFSHHFLDPRSPG